MAKGKYPRSVAKFIRTQKAVIRRRTEDAAEQSKLIKELIVRVAPLSRS
ncbi:hypothetical protein KKG19_02445 [Patescibacteria group bacterium]|nr:hypothetical protein [Patescibacteria group bacterium]